MKILTTLALTLALLSPVAAQECTTVEQDAVTAAENGYTKSVEYKGNTASQFLDAFAKAEGLDRNSLVPMDTLEVRTNPEKEITFVVGFNNGCLIGGVNITDTLEDIFKVLTEMQAHG